MSKVKYLKMVPADNGYVINYTEVSNSGKGTFDDCDYKDHELVYTNVDEAVTKFKELAAAQTGNVSTLESETAKTTPHESLG